MLPVFIQLVDPRQKAPLHLPEQAIDLLATGTPGLNAVGVGAGVAEIDQQIDLLVAEAEQMFRADPRRSHGLIIQGRSAAKVTDQIDN